MSNHSALFSLPLPSSLFSFLDSLQLWLEPCLQGHYLFIPGNPSYNDFLHKINHQLDTLHLSQRILQSCNESFPLLFLLLDKSSEFIDPLLYVGTWIGGHVVFNFNYTKLRKALSIYVYIKFIWTERYWKMLPWGGEA